MSGAIVPVILAWSEVRDKYRIGFGAPDWVGAPEWVWCTGIEKELRRGPRGPKGPKGQWGPLWHHSAQQHRRKIGAKLGGPGPQNNFFLGGGPRPRKYFGALGPPDLRGPWVSAARVGRLKGRAGCKASRSQEKSPSRVRRSNATQFHIPRRLLCPTSVGCWVPHRA